MLAAGAWTGTELLGPDPPFSLRPVKGQLVRLQGPPLIRHVARTPDVYLIPREDGELLIGATVEEMGFDVSPRAGAVMDLLRNAWEVFGPDRRSVNQMLSGRFFVPLPQLSRPMNRPGQVNDRPDF